MDYTTCFYKYEIVHINIRGVRSNKQNLEMYLAEMNYPEIICLNETKLPFNKQFEIEGYTISARREHSDVGGSRGSMILTRNDLPGVTEIECVKMNFKFDEIIGIEIDGENSRPGIKVFTYYNPPLTSPNPAIFKYMASVTGNCLLTGDLNCKNEFWGSTKNDKRGIELLESLSSNNLVTFNNDSFTRCDPSSGKEESLDLIIGNVESAKLFKEFWVGYDIGSDHFPVHALIQFDIPTDQPALRRRNPEKMNQVKWNKILREAEPFQRASTPFDLDNNVEAITNIINRAYKESCPETVIRNRPKCRFTPEIQNRVKEKRKLRRLKNVALEQQDIARVREIMTRINRLGNEIKKIQKQEKKKELERHCRSLNQENNPKKFFSTFGIIAKPILNSETSSSSQRPVQDENGTKASTAQDKANLFANRLQEIHQEPDYVGFDDGWKISVERFLSENEKIFKVDKNEMYSENESGDDSVLCQDVTIDEFDKNLMRCKNKSATGHDGISYYLMKKLPVETKQNLCHIYSDSIRLGYFPKQWKSAIVKVIPKPGKDAKFAKNYRPISLLSCVGKVLERIIADRISVHMEENNMFAKSQSGFRRKRMTSEQIFRLTEECHSAFKKQQTTAALFLDAEAAFDRCWHSGIKFKLKKNLNLPDRIIRLLSSFLTDRTLKVLYNGCYSHSVSLKAGTPQGSPLSPLIYIIYVNDYPEEIQQSCSMSQFADDTALWTSAYTRSYTIFKLQKGLNLLEGWCRKWRVKLNGEKSNLVMIARTRDPDKENYALHLFNDVIRPTQNAKFLGVEIDRLMSFQKQVDSICNRATKRLNVLRVLAKSGTDAKTMMKLYKIYVRPIIEYGSIAFMAAPNSQGSRLQKIENDAIRICLRLPKYIRNSLLHEYASLESISNRLLRTNTQLVRKMRQNNKDIDDLIKSHLQPQDNCHLSPLDVILNQISVSS